MSTDDHPPEQEPLNDHRFLLARYIAGKALYEDSRLSVGPEHVESLELALWHAATDAAYNSYYLPEDVEESREYRGITVEKRDGTANHDREEYYAVGDFHRSGVGGANGRTAADALAHLVRAQVRREASHFRDRAHDRKQRLERLVGDDPTEAEAKAVEFLEELVEAADERRTEVEWP